MRYNFSAKVVTALSLSFPLVICSPEIPAFANQQQQQQQQQQVIPGTNTTSTVSPEFNNEATAAPAASALFSVPIYAGGQGNRAGSGPEDCYYHVPQVTGGASYVETDIADGISSFSLGGQAVIPLNGKIAEICVMRAEVHLEKDEAEIDLAYDRNDRDNLQNCLQSVITAYNNGFSVQADRCEQYEITYIGQARQTDEPSEDPGTLPPSERETTPPEAEVPDQDEEVPSEEDAGSPISDYY